MKNLDFQAIIEKNALLILALVGVVSILPLHFAAFTYQLPENLSGLISSQAKIEISANFVAMIAISSVTARYLPVLILGLTIHLYSGVITSIYMRRGYRLATENTLKVLSPLPADRGLGDNGQQKMRHIYRFGRFKARKSLQIIPATWYFQHQLAATLIGTVTICSAMYSGLSGMIMLAVVMIVSFFAINEFKQTVILAQEQDTGSAAKSMHSFFEEKEVTIWWWLQSNAILLSMLMVVASVILGITRFNYLANNPAPVLVQYSGEQKEANVILAQRNGFFVQFTEDEEFVFLPYTDPIDGNAH